MDTRERLKNLIAEIFKCDPATLTDDVGPGQVPGWDSLGHVTLIAALQKEFGREISLEDAIDVESIADLVRVLDQNTAAG